MNIVITGASRGIGYATAQLMALNTNNTIVAIARNRENLNRLKAAIDCQNANAQLHLIVFDLEKIDSFDALTKLVEKKIQHIDILINMAGHMIRKDFEHTTIDEAKRIFDVNFFAPAKLIASFLPLLRKSKKSHVINISSMAAFQGSLKFSGLSYYAASKGALSTLSECLAQEFKADNIFVNALCLGAVQTEMFAEAFPGHEAPLKAEGMAHFIADFAYNGHKYFNGKVLPVNSSTP